MEESNGSHKTWQLRPRPRKLQIVSGLSPITLHDVLIASADPMLNLQFKRRLALKIAISTLGLHEGTWLRRGWSKKDISFFRGTNGSLDSQKSFLTTDFDDGIDKKSDTGSLFHNNDLLLALGILLIEIHVGRPIEFYQTDGDLTDGKPNMFTGYTVAARVAEKLQLECSNNYNDAIQACLNPPWLSADQEVSLDNPTVRAGLYKDVIQPLKDEVAYLFRENL